MVSFRQITSARGQDKLSCQNGKEEDTGGLGGKMGSYKMTRGMFAARYGIFRMKTEDCGQVDGLL